MCRYQVSQGRGRTAAEGRDHMSASTRKCWARKLREYLHLKAELYGVTVTSEPELLSLLNTAEIKTLGGEVLLTWGGDLLARILNPAVAHEVLMEVALTEPSRFLANGVKYSCMQKMAAALLDLMRHHRNGNIDLAVLTHLHNLLPFANSSTHEADKESIKLFVRAVLRREDKTMCLKKDERDVLRNLLIKVCLTIFNGVFVPNNF